MCTTLIETIGVSAIEGLAGGVLQNYRLNDLQIKPRRDGDEEEDRLTPLLIPGKVDIRKRALEDFNDTDEIFEEFSPPSDEIVNYNDHHGTKRKMLILDFDWKKHRSSNLLSWLKKCFLSAFYIVVLCSFLIASLSVAMMYIDINTSDACFFTDWHLLPIHVQRIRVTVQVIQGWILQYFHIGLMIFVFGFKLVDELHLLHVNVVAAFIDSAYRLFLQVYNVYDWRQKTFPLNVLFVSVIVANSYTLAKHFKQSRRKRLILTFQLGSQFMLGAATLFLTVYLLIPWFIKLPPINQALVAAISPLFGAINKAISRIAIQNVSHINHPGTSYILVVALYIGASLVYRTLQAEIESDSLFFLLCIAHAVVGLLERLSVVLRDHFYLWFHTKFLKKNYEYTSFIGSFRTPRTQRLVADLTICNIIGEINALVYTNAFVQLYALQVGYSADGKVLDANKIVRDFFMRTSIAILIEYVFTALAIFILTWYLNVPVIRVWRKKWKTFLLVNVFTCASMVIYATHYMIGVVAGQYEHLDVTKNQTTTCDLSRLPLLR